MGSPPCLRIPLEPFLFPRVGCQAAFRQVNGKRGGFRTVMGRVGGGGASRPHRGVSTVLFGTERSCLLDLPQWGRAGHDSRLTRMQLMCTIGKNTRYGGGGEPSGRSLLLDRCPAGADGWECVARGRGDSSRFSVAVAPEGSLSGAWDLQWRDAGGRPKG